MEQRLINQTTIDIDQWACMEVEVERSYLLFPISLKNLVLLLISLTVGKQSHTAIKCI